MSNRKTRLSILVPVYYNELNIPHTVSRLQKLQGILPGTELEFVFVDDGSGDRSLELLLAERKKDKRIQVIRLSRNFGSMAAIAAGLHYVTGDCVGIIAADLQDPPELFAEMLAIWKKGKKVVLAVRKDREESLFQKLFSGLYYALMRKLALKDYPRGGFDFLLIDRQVVEEVNRINEKNTNIMSLIFWLGHDREVIPYVRQKRTVGKSRWTLSKKLKLFVDSFVAFSYAPIRIITMVGMVTSVLSICYGAVTVVNWLTGRIKIEGWASVITVVTFLLGLIIIMLGIIGEYLWRILDESRKRPVFLVDQEYTQKEDKRRTGR